MTLDDYMRGMWRVHGKPAAAPGYVERPYTLADARARLAEVSDRAFADDFFQPLHRRPRGAGLREAPRRCRRHGPAPQHGRLDRRGNRRVGTGHRAARHDRLGSPAFEAGLEHEDVLISVDGQPFSAALLKDRKPGDRVTFEVRRRRLGKGTLTFGADPARQAVLNESAGKPLTAEQKAFRAAWLGSQRR